MSYVRPFWLDWLFLRNRQALQTDSHPAKDCGNYLRCLLLGSSAKFRGNGVVTDEISSSWQQPNDIAYSRLETYVAYWNNDFSIFKKVQKVLIHRFNTILLVIHSGPRNDSLEARALWTTVFTVLKACLCSLSMLTGYKHVTGPSWRTFTSVWLW